MSHGPCCRIKGRTHFTSREYLFGHTDTTDTATGQKKTVCLASLLLLIKSCCETESFWKLAEYQCRVQIYLRVYVDVFMFSIELSRETWRKFHTFTVWPNFASKTSVNLAQPEDSSKVNARCLNVSLDNILKLQGKEIQEKQTKEKVSGTNKTKEQSLNILYIPILWKHY